MKSIVCSGRTAVSWHRETMPSLNAMLSTDIARFKTEVDNTRTLVS
jgi:hypothetical protein